MDWSGLPVTLGLRYKYDAEDHVAQYGDNVFGAVRNLQDATFGNEHQFAATRDPITGMAYFNRASASDWPATNTIMHGSTPHAVGNAIAVNDVRTDISFRLVALWESGDPLLLCYASSGEIWSVSNGGLDLGPYIFWQDYGAVQLWGATFWPPAAPWSMRTMQRNNQGYASPAFLRTSWNGEPLVNIFPEAYTDEPYGNDWGMTAPVCSTGFLSYNRVLSDAELAQIFAWALTVLPPMSTEVVERATGGSIATRTVAFSWDEATYGPADMTAPVVRTGLHSGQAIPLDVDSASPVVLTWADAVTQTLPVVLTSPVVPIGATLTELSSDHVTFAWTLVADVAIYRDNVPIMLVPLGTQTYTDDLSGLVPSQVYEYRFEEIGPAGPSGFQTLDVPVPTGGGGGAEFWVSQGGVWVKASEAFGSLAGAWEPV